MKDVTDLIGRVMISFMFIYEGLDSLLYFSDTKEQMTQFGINWQQDLLLKLAIFLLIGGGLMVLLGYRPALGAALLLAYWIPVTCIVHDFWNIPGAEGRKETVEFMRSFAIVGGLLIVLVNGSRRFSMRRLFATTRVPKMPW